MGRTYAEGDPSTIDENYVEIRWASPAEERLRYLVGASHYDYEFDTSIYRDGGYGALVNGTGDDFTLLTGIDILPARVISEVTTNQAIFFNTAYDFTDTITASLEGRLSSDDVGGYLAEYDITDSKKSTSFAPRLGINWSPNADTTYYFQYAVGINPGGVNITLLDPTLIDTLDNGVAVDLTPNDGDPTTQLIKSVDYVASDYDSFDEEKLTNFEIGFKGSAFDNRLTYNGAIYHMIWEDQVQTIGLDWDYTFADDDLAEIDATIDVGGQTFPYTYEVDDTAANVLGNSGTSKITGLELTANYLINDNWSIRGNTSISNAKYSDYCSEEDYQDTLDNPNAQDLGEYAGLEVSSFVDGLPILGSIGAINISAATQIEVYSGPQSAAFGRSTFAGAINYITADPADELEGTLGINWSDQGTRIVSGSLSGPLTNSLGFHLTGQYEDSVSPDADVYSFSDGVESNTIGGTNVSARFVFEPNDRFKAKLTFSRDETDDGPTSTFYATQASSNACARSLENLFVLDTGTGPPAVGIDGAFDCELNLDTHANLQAVNDIARYYEQNTAAFEELVLDLRSQGATDAEFGDYSVEEAAQIIAAAFSVPFDDVGSQSKRDRVSARFDFLLESGGDIQLSLMTSEEEYLRQTSPINDEAPLAIGYSPASIDPDNVSLLNEGVPVDLNQDGDFDDLDEDAYISVAYNSEDYVIFSEEKLTNFEVGFKGTILDDRLTKDAWSGTFYIENALDDRRITDGSFAAEALVRKIENSGGQAVTAQADISDPGEVARMFDAAEAAYGGVDVLVNNAGIMKLASIADSNDEIFDRQVAVNLKGVFNTLRQAAKRLREGGRIINLSSSVVGLYQPTYGIYAATKAGVEALTHVLTKEMRGRRITVNAVAPGPTATDLFLEGKPQEVIDRLANLAPLERLGQPEDIAAAVAFLAGPDAAWVNGQTLRVNGGIL
eukprot:g4437.t1